MSATLEQKLEALSHQLSAATPGRWRMDDDPRHASLFSLVQHGKLEHPQLVATGMLPQDARLVEMVMEVLPEMLEIAMLERGVQKRRWTATDHPCVKVDHRGDYWVDGVFSGVRHRLKCESKEAALDHVRRFQGGE